MVCLIFYFFVAMIWQYIYLKIYKKYSKTCLQINKKTIKSALKDCRLTYVLKLFSYKHMTT